MHTSSGFQPAATTPGGGIPAGQARTCVAAFREVATGAFFDGRPEDRLLGKFFRENRQLGARDRRFVMEAVFAALRWWGWSRFLLSNPARDGFAARHQPGPAESAATWLSERDAALALLVGAVLEDLPAAAAWLAVARLAATDLPTSGETTASERIEAGRLRLLAWQPQATTLTATDLLPEWCLPLLPPELPVDKLIDWLQRRPPMWLRTQGRPPAELIAELQAAGLELAGHPRLDTALRVPHPRVNLYTLPSFLRGEFEVQDLASQAIGLACSPAPGQRWWDACAGAGGKTLQLAELMQRKGTVVASDIRAYKLDDLRKRARRAAFPNIQCRDWDGHPVRPKQANFDGVLVDAPCTCSGTWRRNPAARWRALASDVDELGELQARIVANAASALRPGGVLVFATCSLFPRENDANVEHLQATTNLRLEPFPHPLTGETTNGTLQLWPWDGDCDAMFVARFRHHP